MEIHYLFSVSANPTWHLHPSLNAATLESDRMTHCTIAFFLDSYRMQFSGHFYFLFFVYVTERKKERKGEKKRERKKPYMLPLIGLKLGYRNSLMSPL